VRGEDKRETLYDSSCTAHSTSQKCCTPPTNPNPKRNDTYTDIGEIREERYQTNCYQTRCFTDLYVTNYSFCITTSTCDLHMGHFFSHRTSVVDPEPSTGFVKERGQVNGWRGLRRRLFFLQEYPFRKYSGIVSIPKYLT